MLDLRAISERKERKETSSASPHSTPLSSLLRSGEAARRRTGLPHSTLQQLPEEEGESAAEEMRRGEGGIGEADALEVEANVDSELAPSPLGPPRAIATRAARHQHRAP